MKSYHTILTTYEVRDISESYMFYDTHVTIEFLFDSSDSSVAYDDVLTAAMGRWIPAPEIAGWAESWLSRHADEAIAIARAENGSSEDWKRKLTRDLRLEAEIFA